MRGRDEWEGGEHKASETRKKVAVVLPHFKALQATT